jgi:L-malate glycosyltransferase
VTPTAAPLSPGGPRVDRPAEPLSLQLVGSKALGGAERWFVRFAAALADRGARAELGIRRGSALEGLVGDLPLHRLPFLTVWDPWSRAAVSHLIRRIRPDIVQTYMGRATRLTHLKGRGGPVHVARLGGYYRLDPYRHAHAWIGNTRGLCDWMLAQGLPAGRVFHIYNFAEPVRSIPEAEIADLRADLAVPADAWVLLAPGRFVPVKGHCHLIKAMAALPREIAGRPLRLILLGDGPLRGDMERQAERLGIADRLIWPGWRKDPGPYFRLADLVVFPSLEEETLGNVILEAWSWRRPLVTSLFRGAREIARQGEDAWCVPCADAKALGAGIRALLEEPHLAAALVTRGAQRVQAEFGRDAIVGQYLDLYRRLVGA